MNFDDGSTRQRAPSNPYEQGHSQGTSTTDSPFSNQNFQGQIGQMMWEAGSRQIKDSFNSYGRIDIFRPYFDVEPKQVRNRLFQSFIPRKPSQINVTNDLYGPTMIVLTMVALLLFNMKSSGFTTQDGTLIGTAMVSCFGTWLSLSVCIYTLCFLLSTDVPMVQVFSLFGYSMTSHCVVLLLTSIFHPVHDHFYFFFLLVVFCVPSALRMGMYISGRTREKPYKMTLMCVVMAVHLLYITYLHFGFHVVVEELDEMWGEPVNEIMNKVPVPPQDVSQSA